MIWVHLDEKTRIDSARRRDVAWVGSVEVVEQRYRQRMLPVHHLYGREGKPVEGAHAVIDNRQIASPRILRLETAPK